MASYTDAATNQLRALVATIDQQIARTPPSSELQAAWTDLVGVLALGPAPMTRVCPSCHTVGMRAASRCGNCWVALSSLPKLEEVSV